MIVLIIDDDEWKYVVISILSALFAVVLILYEIKHPSKRNIRSTNSTPIYYIRAVFLLLISIISAIMIIAM